MRIATLGVCVFLAAAVFVAMFASICRSQGGRDAAPGGRRALTIELLWAAVPCLVVVAVIIPAVVEILEGSGK